MHFTSRRAASHKAQRLGSYPALAGVDRRALANIATWADEFTIASGEVVQGLTSIGRWTYLIADPSARILVPGGCRPAGQVLAHADSNGAISAVIAVDDLNVLAVPTQRLGALLEIAPRLTDALVDREADAAVVDPLCGEGLPKSIAALAG